MKKFLSIRIILSICLLGTLVFLIGCTPPVSIHTGTVKGVINVYWPNAEDFMPGAARIDVLDEGIFTVSSFSDGSYTLSNVPVGQHTITVFKHGYITAQQVVNVVEDQTVTNVDFNLETEISAEQLGRVEYLCFNLDVTPFNDLKVRQALNYAIDKQTLVDEINSEFGFNRVVAQGLIPPSIMGYNPGLVGYSYDVNTAQALLSQAGYSEGFNTSIYFNTGNDVRQFIAEKVKVYLAQIGVNVETHGVELNQLLGMVEGGESAFFNAGWGLDTPDPTDAFYSLYHSSASPYNYSHYHNSTIDNLIEQAWATIDETEFIQLIQQIESTIVNDAPAIYIYHY